MIHMIQQQTPEWLQFRVGKVTASRVKDVMDLTQKSLPTMKRKRYMIEIVCERLTGFAVDHFVSDAMIWGTDNEKYARAAYEIHSGNEVETCAGKDSKVGIATHPRIELLAASPDGLINADGLFEAKCPNTVTHIEWMMEGVVPEEHRDQCLTQIVCWERDWNDFVSYDPRIENYPELQLFTPPRIYRDEKRIGEIEQGVERFLEETETVVQKLLARCGNPEQVREQMQSLKLKEQLKRSVEEFDPEMGITDADLPAWARAMGDKL